MDLPPYSSSCSCLASSSSFSISVVAAFEAGLPRFRFVLASIEVPPRVNFGPLLTANEPNSPAGVFAAVVFGVSCATEFALVEAAEGADDSLLPAMRRLLAVFGAILGTITPEKTRFELDRAALNDALVDGAEDALSERSSSTSEELGTNLRDVTVFNSLLLGFRP